MRLFVVKFGLIKDEHFQLVYCSSGSYVVSTSKQTDSRQQIDLYHRVDWEMKEQS